MKPLKTFMIGLLLALSACGGNNNPNLPASVEGKIAVYGDRVLEGVEKTQQFVIQFADKTGKKEAVAPAMRAFQQIGKRGQELADVLDQIDRTDVLATKQELALRARNILNLIAVTLTTVGVDVGDFDARKNVADAITNFVNSPLFDLLQALSRYIPLPAPKPSGAVHVPQLQFAVE